MNLSRRLTSVLALGALVTFASTATAQTYTWSGQGANANWSTAANWDTTPVSANNTAIVLSIGSYATAPGSIISTNQDISSPFVLNSLTQNQTLNAAADGTSGRGFVVSGGPLSFQGSNANITTLQSGSTPSVLRIDSAVNFATNTTLNIQGNITAANNGAELVLNGALTVASGTTITATSNQSTGAGINITSANNFGFQGTLKLDTGSPIVVNLAAVNAISRSTIIDTTGSSTNSTVRAGVSSVFALADAGFNQQIGRLVATSTTAGSFQVGAGTTTATALVGFDNLSSTFNGTIGLNGNTTTRNAHFGKVGTGTLTLGAASTTGFGTFSVRDGTVALEGANGSFNSPNFELAIYNGATLHANNATNSNNNRLPGSGGGVGDRAIVIAGGTLRLSGTASTTAAFSEIASGIRLTSGQSTLLIDNVGNTKATRISFTGTGAAGGLEQLGNSTATVFFRSTNLGQSSSTSTTNTTGGFAFSTAPTLVGGAGADGSANISILSFGFGTGATSGSNVTNAESFVTYSTANNSIRSLTDAEYASTFGTATNNVSLNATTTVSSATTANAVRIVAGGSIDNSSTLNVTSGALLNNGGGDITGTGTVSFGTAAAPTTAYITTNGAFNISNAISATNLSKNGVGNLTLTGTTTLATGANNGTVAVNAGTLTLGGGSSVVNAATYQISRGATLDVTANGLTVGANQTLRGNGTVAGNVTVNGGTIAASSLAGSSANLASSGQLAITGNLTLGVGGRYDWFVNSALDGQYTQSRINVTGTVDLSGLSATSQFVIRPTSLLLSNTGAGNVYDFESNIGINPAGYSWTLITSTGGITGGFSADKFQVDTAGFSNNLNGGSFSVAQVGNNLVLNFTPVPEPTTVLAIGAAGLAAAGWVRRRRTAKTTPATAA